MIKTKIINLYRHFFKTKPSSQIVLEKKLDQSFHLGQDENVGTAPRTKAPLKSASEKAQNLVWDNEDASMQDKSYSFDEQVTDANYEEEDSLDFYDSDDEREIQKDRFE